MRILILNWKDIKNPQYGGAEILTHEMAKRFVKEGHKVIMFVSDFKNARSRETIDGVKIIRSGKPDLRTLNDSVHYKAFKYYRKELRGKIDVIIDEVHGMPFFAKLYAKEKVIALVCEVADDIWFRMFSFPWSLIGWIFERMYLLIYKNVPILAISNSTETELISCGIAKKNITVLPMGINRIRIKNEKKEKEPTLIFVGRLNKTKGIRDAIIAVSIEMKKIKNLQLWIVGRGEETFVQSLKKLSKKTKAKTKFWDHVSEHKKFELMSRAHAIVVPSLREGFGLVVPEAGSVGTPAIVYDGHGVRDTVKTGVNGIKVAKTPDDLAKGIERLFSEDDKRYKAFCISAKRESLQYNWDNTAKVALKAIKNEL
jgi:glycosyltransferase involved in cell wall biosynthesis